MRFASRGIRPNLAPAKRGHQGVVRRNPLDLPPDVVRAFLKDMKAFFAEDDRLKRDAIAVRQLHALKEHQGPREKPLRLSDIREMFEELKDF